MNFSSFKKKNSRSDLSAEAKSQRKYAKRAYQDVSCLIGIKFMRLLFGEFKIFFSSVNTFTCPK